MEDKKFNWKEFWIGCITGISLLGALTSIMALGMMWFS